MPFNEFVEILQCDKNLKDISVIVSTFELQSAAGRLDQFLLFGTILEATMVDKKIGDKPIYFELTIGMNLELNIYELNGTISLCFN